MNKIFFLLLFFTCFFTVADDYSVLVSWDREKGILCSFDDGKALDLGVLPFDGTGKSVLKLVNREEKRDFNILSLRSTCSCIVLPEEDLPGILKSKEFIYLEIKVDTSGYLGTIEKCIHLRLQFGDLKKDFWIPVRFTVNDEATPEIVSTMEKTEDMASEIIRFVDYKGGGPDAYKKASAWLFSSKNCPKCNFTKSVLLPKLLSVKKLENLKIEIVVVDLDEGDGFDLLVALEEKLKIKPGEEVPVLYFENLLYYGNEDIKELIKKQTEQTFPED